jgi:hypothetical protein
MEILKLQAHVGSDGILKLELPVGDVMVYSIQPKTEQED